MIPSQIFIDDMSFDPSESIIVSDASGNVIIDEDYSTYNGKIDFSDVFLPYFTYSRPTDTEKGILQSGLVQQFKVNNDAELMACGFIHPLHFLISNKFSDIDVLRIPHNYICPLVAAGFPASEIGFADGNGRKIFTREGFENDAEAIYIPRIFALHLPAHPGPMRPYWKVDRTYDGTLLDSSIYVKGPLLIPTAGHFEQYLFANKYGGYDNLPMDGTLEYIPEHNFETGISGEVLRNISSETRHSWKQNSGFQTRKTIETLATLIQSKAIWHLKDGTWQQIVITSCDISLSSQDNLHSMTFEYKHIDEA